MGERYWITGAQLGMLISIRDINERKKTVNDIEENQFICDIENEQIKEFSKDIAELNIKYMKDKDEE